MGEYKHVSHVNVTYTTEEMFENYKEHAQIKTNIAEIKANITKLLQQKDFLHYECQRAQIDYLASVAKGDEYIDDLYDNMTNLDTAYNKLSAEIESEIDKLEKIIS